MAQNTGLTAPQRIALHEISTSRRGLSDAGLKRAGITAGTVKALRRRGYVEWDEYELESGATIHVLKATN